MSVHKERRQQKKLALFELPWTTFNGKVSHTDSCLVRQRLFLEYEGRCDECNLYEWLGKEIPLELEHCDGDHQNNERSNLRILCPNCHAMTPTWRGRNKVEKRKTVSDEELLHALKTQPSIRRALISVGLAGKGNNYRRAHLLKATMGS